jgi:FAD/FMN-containing dehydrogenase
LVSRKGEKINRMETKIPKHTKLTGELVFVGSPGYHAAREDLIKLYQSYPYVVVFVHSVEDVKNALAWSQENNVTLRPRCGRASTEGWSNINNGVVIDVSKLKTIEIDTKCERVVVGAGVLQGELMNALSNTGYFTALGNEGILGLIGVLLGGGIGLLSRNKGPGCDSLLETTTVLADGCVVRASQKKNSDLFFAERGGGGNNFGVVTSYTMRLYKAPPLVVVFECVVPFATYSEFAVAFETWQRWAPFVEDTRLSSNCSVFSTNVDIKGVFLGDLKQLGNLLDPLKMLSGVLTITEKPFSQWFTSSPGVEQPFQKYSPGWYHRTIGKRGLQAIYKHMLTSPSPQSNFFCLAWGGNTRIVPKGGTAFPKPNRNALFYGEPGAEWADRKINAQALDWVQTLRLALSRYFHLGYVNVLDRGIERYGEEYYGKKNFAKLQLIKRKYDPTNVFHFEQSIPVCQV